MENVSRLSKKNIQFNAIQLNIDNIYVHVCNAEDSMSDSIYYVYNSNGELVIMLTRSKENVAKNLAYDCCLKLYLLKLII